eukprot:3331789-Prorocentrum_lima.AAC.1
MLPKNGMSSTLERNTTALRKKNGATIIINRDGNGFMDPMVGNGSGDGEPTRPSCLNSPPPTCPHIKWNL